MADYSKILADLSKISNNKDLNDISSGPKALNKRVSSQVDLERKPWGVFKALDYLNRLGYPVQNTLRRATDPYRDYSIKEYLSGIKKGLLGQERSQTTDTFENLGWRPTSVGGKIARGTVGFVGDILLDPMTYIPFGQLTKAGKLAEAGKLVKYGDKIFDITSKSNADELAKMISTGMRALGKNSDDIGKATSLLGGIVKRGLGDDIVKALGDAGYKGAEVVKLAPTWAKQYKLGQRALAQIEVPKIIPLIGGASADLRNPLTERLSQRLFNTGTFLNRRLQAGRMLADKAVIKGLPEATYTMRKAAGEGNLVKLGDEVFNLGNKVQAGKVRNKVLSMADDVSAADMKKIRNLFKAEKGAKGLAEKAVNGIDDLVSDTGLQKVNLGELNSKAVAAKFGANPIWKSAGAAANQVATAFNIIPKGAKAIRRFASGSSTYAAQKELDDIMLSLGKDGRKKLAYGLSDGAKKSVMLGGNTVDVAGDDLLRLRLEGLEGIGNKTVAKEIADKADRAAKGGWKFTIDDITSSLDKIDASKGAKTGKVVDGIEGIGGLDGETVARMKATLRDWGKDDEGVKNILDLSNALQKAENASINLGAIERATAENRHLTEALGYLPRRKALTAQEEALSTGAKSAVEEARAITRNQTIFEAAQGYRSPVAVEYLKKNRDKVITYAPNGKGITGGDILDANLSAKLKAAGDKVSKATDAFGKLNARLAKKSIRLNKTQAGTEGWEKLRREVVRLGFQTGEKKASLDKLQKTYDDIANIFAKTDWTKTSTNEFSTDFAAEIFKNLDAAQNKLQRRLALVGMVEYGTPIVKGKPLPQGYVRASDVISSGALGDLLKGADDAGVAGIIGMKELSEKLQNTAIPHQFVRPLKEMIEMSGSGQKGILLNMFDATQGMLKSWMLSLPSTHFRNFVSSFFMAYAAGDFANPGRGLANFAQAIKYAAGKGKWGEKVAIRGKNYAVRDLWDLYTKYSGAEAGRVASDFIIRAKDEINNPVMRALQKGTKTLNAPQSAVAELTENAFRFNHFINELKKGSTLEDAVESVALHFYDYGDLSKFEKSVSRRLIPFYTFWRKNMEANARYLVKNAGYLATPHKLRANINRITEADPETMPDEWLDNKRNRWLLTQGAFRLPWSPTTYVNLKGFLPQAEVDMPSISPIFKNIPEALANYDSFTKRDLKRPDKPKELVLGVPIDPRLYHVLKPLRPIDLANRMLIRMSPDYARAAGYKPRIVKNKFTDALGEIGGIRNYPQEREKVRNYRKTDLKADLRTVDYALTHNDGLSPYLRAQLEAQKAELQAALARAEE